MKSIRDLALNGEDEPEEPKKPTGKVWGHSSEPSWDDPYPSYGKGKTLWSQKDGYLGKVETKEPPEAITSKFIVYIQRSALGEVANEENPRLYNYDKMIDSAEEIALTELQILAGPEVDLHYHLTFAVDEFGAELEVEIKLKPL